MSSQPVPYNAAWNTVPIAFVDFETTGIRPGIDQAVEVGIARFEHGQLVAQRGTLLDPGVTIPAEVSQIHGITDEMVIGKPHCADFFAHHETKALLDGAQPAAYNAGFDRWFLPPWALADWTWPWLDTLTLVRIVDRYVRGAGRHKLTNACARHGIQLMSAHRADDDARAAGELFFKLMPHVWNNTPKLGELLGWMRQREADQWIDFQSWLARQTRRETAAP